MNGLYVFEREPKANEEVLVRIAAGGEAEEVFQLVENQQDGGAEREPDDDGVGDVARQVAQAQQRDAGLDEPDKHREHDGARDLGVWIWDKSQGA